MKRPPPRPPQKPAALRWSGCSDTGRVRKNNEDAFLGLRFDAQEVHRLGKSGEADTAKHDFTFAVCDGMGGAQAGEFASNIAVVSTRNVSLPSVMGFTPAVSMACNSASVKSPSGPIHALTLRGKRPCCF